MPTTKAIYKSEDAISEFKILEQFYIDKKALGYFVRCKVIKGVRRQGGALIDRQSLMRFIEYLKKENETKF
jgi:hypothetical protein